MHLSGKRTTSRTELCMCSDQWRCISRKQAWHQGCSCGQSCSNLDPFKRGDSLQSVQLVCTQTPARYLCAATLKWGGGAAYRLCSHPHMWDVWNFPWSTKKEPLRSNLKAPSWRARHWFYFWFNKWLLFSAWSKTKLKVSALPTLRTRQKHLWNKSLLQHTPDSLRLHSSSNPVSIC